MGIADITAEAMLVVLLIVMVASAFMLVSSAAYLIWNEIKENENDD